jgi:hypothetical protein
MAATTNFFILFPPENKNGWKKFPLLLKNQEGILSR